MQLYSQRQTIRFQSQRRRKPYPEESDTVDTSKLVRPDVASADQVNKYQEFDEKSANKKNKKRGGRK